MVKDSALIFADHDSVDHGPIRTLVLNLKSVFGFPNDEMDLRNADKYFSGFLYEHLQLRFERHA